MLPTTDRISREPGQAPQAQVPLSALSRTSAVALAGQGLIYLFQFFLVWLAVGVPAVLLLPILIIGLVSLLVAGLVLAHRRWAPPLGALVAAVALITLLLDPVETATLAHPAVNPGHFGTLVVELAFGAVAIVAGVAAIPALRGQSAGSRPTWLAPFVSGVSGAAVGLILSAILVAAHPVSGSAISQVNGMPAVHMAGDNFLTNVVLVPKGKQLVLVDDDGMEHVITNGSWTPGGAPAPQVEPGAPVVHLQITGRSVEVGPFETAGIFHLYCTLHRGMNLTVVVQ